MDNQLILIADEDEKNLEILKENLEASGFFVITVTNGKDAWEETQKTPPKLILTETALPGLSGYQLIERLKTDPNTSSIPLIFLTKQREVQQRIRAFEMGAKDYLVKPLHVKEVIAHIRMILRRLESRKIDQFETYKRFSGRLDQLNLPDLIESFGIERKTGILTLSNGRKTGQVFFREGSVVNASIGDFKMEQAVYQMFPWKQGYFNMIFRDVDVAEDISISNLGLLLQGMKRLEIREKLIKQLPPQHSAFTITPTFKSLLQKKHIGDDANEFTKLLDGNKNIEQIVDDSSLDDLIALKRLLRLYQQGFIKPTVLPEKKAAAKPLLIEAEEKVAFASSAENFEEITSATFETEQLFEPNGNNINEEDKSEVDAFGLKPEDKKPVQFHKTEKPISGYESETGPSLQLRRELSPKATPPEPDKVQPEEADVTKEESIFNLNPSEPDIDNNGTELEEIEQMISPVEERIENNLDISSSTREAEPSLSEKTALRDDAQNAGSFLKDDNIEDYVFEIKPLDRQKLEQEIKPIFDSIQLEKKQTPEPEKPATSVPENKKTPPKTISQANEKAETKINLPPLEDDLISTDEFEETFVDEELIRQSVSAKKTTPPEPKKHIEHATVEKKAAEPVINNYDLQLPVGQQDKIVLISVDDDCKDELMEILTDDNFKTLKLNEQHGIRFDFGKLKYGDQTEIKLIAIPIEKNLDQFLDSIKQTVIANVFTFDCSLPETWEYTNYLINSISDKYSIPSVVAVFNLEEHENLNLEVIRYKLNIDEQVPIISCAETDKNCKVNLLNIFFEIEDFEPETKKIETDRVKQSVMN